MNKIHFFSGIVDEDIEKCEAARFIDTVCSWSGTKFRIESRPREKDIKLIACLEGGVLRAVLSGITVDIEELWKLIPTCKRM